MIVLVEATGTRPAAVSPLVLIAVVPLAACARAWQPARPLLPYLCVMVPVFGIAYILPSLLSGWQPVEGSVLCQTFLNKAVFLVLAAMTAVFLVAGLRFTPREAFLTPGGMSSPNGLRLPGGRSTLNWAAVGPALAGTLLVLFGVPTWLGSGLGLEFFVRLGPFLPLVIGAAAFNALAEEIVYRAGPLATLTRVVGPRQAVLLTSVWFGLAHYFGSVPEGFGGVVQSGVLALVLGWAMVATRGLGWPWILHFAIDLVVFASIAVGSS